MVFGQYNCHCYEIMTVFSNEPNIGDQMKFFTVVINLVKTRKAITIGLISKYAIYQISYGPVDS